MVAYSAALFLAIAFTGSTPDCVILEFTSAHCEPCKQMQPAIRQAVDDGWIVRQIDAVGERELVERWRVTDLPTIIVTRSGKEVDRLVGVTSYDRMQQRFRAASHARSEIAKPASPPAPIIRGQSPASLTTLSATMSTIGNLPTQFNQQAGPVSDPQNATVRIRIEDSQSIAYGTGTIIDRHGDEALVLTCGHLFREMNPESKLMIEVFADGRAVSLPASVVDFRADSVDIGLVSFRPGREVGVVKLLPLGQTLQEHQPVFSYGCDRGSDPTRRDSKITKLNRYLGPANVEVAGAPIQGRSGGGLFDIQGQLIGVCYAADKEYNEGLYSGPDVVYSQLAKLKLTRLYETPKPSPMLASSTPTGRSPQETLIASQDPNRNETQPNGSRQALPQQQLASNNRSSAISLTPLQPIESQTAQNPNQEIFLVIRKNGEQDRVIPVPNPASTINAIIREGIR